MVCQFGSLCLLSEFLLVGAHHLDEVFVFSCCEDYLHVDVGLAVLVLLESVEELFS